MGPLQLLVLGFDGNQFKGEIAPELSRLKREGIVRIVDLLLVRKDDDGAVGVITASDLDWKEAVEFGEVAGTLAGLLRTGDAERGSMAGAAELMDGHLFDESDRFNLERSLPAGWSGAIVLFEHLWALPLLERVWRAGGFELSNAWVSPEELIEVPERSGAPADDPGLDEPAG
jgi:uncharacterized membrane protein